MPGGRAKEGRIPKGMRFFGDEVFRLRRPAMIFEWGHPREGGVVEIVGFFKVWPDVEGRVREWLSIHCYFEDDDCEPYTKRYPPDDLTSYREDLAHLPSVVLIGTMEARGFRYSV